MNENKVIKVIILKITYNPIKRNILVQCKASDHPQMT